MYWDVRDELITVVGDVALVRSTNKETVRQGGEEVTSMSTYTDTYVFEGGRWQCVQAQITPVAEVNEPADDTIVSVWIRGVRQPDGRVTPRLSQPQRCAQLVVDLDPARAA